MLEPSWPPQEASTFIDIGLRWDGSSARLEREEREENRFWTYSREYTTDRGGGGDEQRVSGGKKESDEGENERRGLGVTQREKQRERDERWRDKGGSEGEWGRKEVVMRDRKERVVRGGRGKKRRGCEGA